MKKPSKQDVHWVPVEDAPLRDLTMSGTLPEEQAEPFVTELR
jgi:hypothetical protein